jgi:SSS family solute:Na+ symporter
MFALRFPGHGSIIRIPVCATLFIRNVTMIGMQFTALGYMMTYVLGIDKRIAILVVFVTITGYTCLSGLWAIVSTDVIQGFLQTVGLVVLLVVSMKLSGHLGNLQDFITGIAGRYEHGLFDISEQSGKSFIYLICFAAFFIMGDQSDWERIYSSRSRKVAFWGYLIPLTITLMLLLLPALIGNIISSYNADVDISGHLLYWFLFEKVAPALSFFIMITLLSAVMSTADSFMIASGNLFTNDIIKRFLHREAGQKELIFWTRMGVILAGAVGFAFAVTFYDIILLWTSGLAIGTIVLIPEYLFMWFSRRVNTKGALAGMLTAAVYCAAALLSGIGLTLPTILIGVLTNCAVAFTVSLLTERPEPRSVRLTYFFSVYGEKKVGDEECAN